MNSCECSGRSGSARFPGASSTAGPARARHVARPQVPGELVGRCSPPTRRRWSGARGRGAVRAVDVAFGAPGLRSAKPSPSTSTNCSRSRRACRCFLSSSFPSVRRRRTENPSASTGRPSRCGTPRRAGRSVRVGHEPDVDLVIRNRERGSRRRSAARTRSRTISPRPVHGEVVLRALELARRAREGDRSSTYAVA